MSGVLGGLLPLGAAVAVSPVPLLALVVVLLTGRSRGAGAGFLLGWALGVTGAVLAASTLSSRLPAPDHDASAVAAVAQIVLGVALVVVATRLGWTGRGRTGRARAGSVKGRGSRVVSAVGALTFLRAVPVGLSLSLNPKALAVAAAAGLHLGAAPTPVAGTILGGLVYVLTAVSTVAVVVVLDLYAGPRLAAPLRAVRSWLLRHAQLLTAAVVAGLGVLLLARGLGGT